MVWIESDDVMDELLLWTKGRLSSLSLRIPIVSRFTFKRNESMTWALIEIAVWKSLGWHSLMAAFREFFGSCWARSASFPLRSSLWTAWYRKCRWGCAGRDCTSTHWCWTRHGRVLGMWWCLNLKHCVQIAFWKCGKCEIKNWLNSRKYDFVHALIDAISGWWLISSECVSEESRFWLEASEL